ncbi:flagellar hook protein [Buchnera aphidicola (Hyadaphis tataricae)]|uniref:Flagellar hook-associated protein 1 n=1 Tax=Buchnera aphidicola (Hyadaphis tataricae) TaxID=1241859 RepID=A0A4D6XYP5_9GAMM|nr:flagellar hook protein [Buchnera aphidicola]QCI21643.1 flagellar hook protein [Buchnera aphidicola (Hyadaphis tataricae)]
MSDIFNSVISGINAMKTMIDDTVEQVDHPSRNNVNKRIFVENTVQPPETSNSVKVQEIYDDYNDFIVEEKRKTNTQVKEDETTIEQLSKLEDLLGQEANTLSTAINALYEQIEIDFSDNALFAIDNNFHNAANKVTDAANKFDKKLQFLETNVKNLVIENINKVNSLIDQIENANIDIYYFPIDKSPKKIDDLINKREKLIDELSALIDIKIVKDKNNYEIYLDNNFCILDKHQKKHFIALTSSEDEKYISIGYFDEQKKQTQKIENIISTGVLGALLTFRRDELSAARNTIGQLIARFSEYMNHQLVLEADQFRRIGKPRLYISNPIVLADVANHSSHKTTAIWLASAHSQNTDYIVSFQNNHWFVTRLADHQQIQFSVINSKNGNVSIVFDDIQLSISGKPDNGDMYMVKPYSKTLEKLRLILEYADTNVLSSGHYITKNVQNNKILFKPRFFYHQDHFNLDYQTFHKSISHKCNQLKEEVPFKRNMVNILQNKRVSTLNNIEKIFQKLNYEQECYLANVRVLKVAESIFNEIVDSYS